MTRIVAFGGGHGLAASLRALRALQNAERYSFRYTKLAEESPEQDRREAERCPSRDRRSVRSRAG